ncbi:hypothetical protein NLM33_44880 [Bradyrhizobium sp. CCGUVB1N3]|uniref:hypothetical protein n=1 Tax=Bradyrhizobium sp. CCGUVB1N3 TaxID=2949629 RepID=UPI0020B180EB|nr:hypothetical protein [Bradyrhizobium sp. CCGUVB1N3]MCP3477297.1 hypothetical protein [Bradyrhizobium sp. CCGUVB1N3]
MARHRKDLGARRHVRVDLYRPGFLIPAPDAPWIECTIVDVSDEGVSLDVGALPVPKVFGLSFTTGGEVIRICILTWRNGEHVGARFVRARDLRRKRQREAARETAGKVEGRAAGRG